MGIIYDTDNICGACNAQFVNLGTNYNSINFIF